MDKYIVYLLERDGFELCILSCNNPGRAGFISHSEVYEHKIFKRISSKLCTQILCQKDMCKAPDDWRFYNPDVYRYGPNDLNQTTIKLVSELLDIKDISKIRKKLEHLENTKIFYCYYA